MAGLLDDDGTLESAGFLRGLLGASQQRKRPFTMLLGGLAGMQQAQAMAAQQAQAQAMAERKLAIEEALKNAQISNFQSEAEQRSAAIERQQRLEAMGSRLLGGSTVGHGVAGSGVSLSGVQEPYRPAGIENARLSDVAALRLAGGPDLLDAWKTGQTGVKQEGGSSYVLNGRSTYVPSLDKNMTMDGGRASLIPGVADALAAQTSATTEAQERAKAGYTLAPADVKTGVTSQTMRQLVDDLQPQGGAPSGLIPVNGRVPQNEKQASQDLIDFAIAQRTNIGGTPRRGVQTMLTPGEQAQASADKQWAEKRAVSNANQYEKILESGFTAPTNIARYEQIGRLLADHDGGKLSPLGLDIASTANSLGLKMKNLPNKEAAEALANELALTKRNPSSGAGMPGAMSDADREYLKKITPNMAQSKEGRQILIDVNIALSRRDQEVAEAARKYVEQKGKLDDDFFAQLSRWANAHPLFGK